MSEVVLTAAEDAMIEHLQAQTSYRTPASIVPVSAQLRAWEEVRPLGTVLQKFRVAIALCFSTAAEVTAAFTGTPSADKYLCSDGTLKVPPGGGGSGSGNGYFPGGW